jgi:4-hydroxythreonine-4-phosphate dehydrogenase
MPAPATRIPRVGITLGDPRGIGAEITLDALAHAPRADYRLIGPSGLTPADVAVDVVGEWTPDQPPEEAGRLAGLAIARGVDLAVSGAIDALVTAPIDKAAFHAGGWHFPGHTEMLQALTGARAVAMMMAAERTIVGGPLRVVLATTHLALRDVPSAFTTPLLVEQTRLTVAALRKWWGLSEPRAVLCAFNPHASDGGLFGDEEARVYGPALEELAEEGIPVAGPLPADTVFRRAAGGEFDAVIAPYHDVGMAAFKTVAFGTGVNVTLGLPFPRTSPDHGTALDIAGRGLADPTSMIESLRLAVRLASMESFDTLRGGS